MCGEDTFATEVLLEKHLENDCQVVKKNQVADLSILEHDIFDDFDKMVSHASEKA